MRKGRRRKVRKGGEKEEGIYIADEGVREFVKEETEG